MRLFLKSFIYAFRGVHKAFGGRNLRVQIAIALLVVVAGILLHISFVEWTLCALSIGMVLSAEIMNSAIESLCNFVSPEKHTQIAYVKDMAAGAVLVAAISAAIVGLIIFVPKITVSLACAIH